MTLRPIPTDRAEWHRLRMQFIGGSESAALHGCQADYQLSAFALFHIKTGAIPAPEVDNERTAWGLRLERPIAEAAAAQEGWTLHPGQYAVDDTTEGMGATLDFIIQPSAEDEANGFTGPGVLEIKNVDWLQYRRAWAGDEPPPHILIQHQHQIACAGMSWGAVACLVGGNELKVRRYKARPKLIAAIRRKVAEFWQSTRQNRPPAPDGSDSTAETLRALYPDADEAPLDLTTDNEMPELCAAMLRAAEARKAAEKDEDAAKHAIRAKLAGHGRALVQGFSVKLSIGADTPDRPALPDEIIKGRRGAVRLYVKEMNA